MSLSPGRLAEGKADSQWMDKTSEVQRATQLVGGRTSVQIPMLVCSHSCYLLWIITPAQSCCRFQSSQRLRDLPLRCDSHRKALTILCYVRKVGYKTELLYDYIFVEEKHVNTHSLHDRPLGNVWMNKHQHLAAVGSG